jgi:hypothetical protein
LFFLEIALGTVPGQLEVPGPQFIRDLQQTSSVYSPFAKQFTIIAICVDSLNGIESSDDVRYTTVLTSGDCEVKIIKLENRYLKIAAPKARKVTITYGTFSVSDKETPVTGAVIEEMQNREGFFTHHLRDDATMLGTIYLSS